MRLADHYTKTGQVRVLLRAAGPHTMHRNPRLTSAPHRVQPSNEATAGGSILIYNYILANRVRGGVAMHIYVGR